MGVIHIQSVVSFRTRFRNGKNISYLDQYKINTL